MQRAIRPGKRSHRGQRNTDRSVVKVTSNQTRVVRRARRRAEKAEIVEGYRAGKSATRAQAGGYWYA